VAGALGGSLPGRLLDALIENVLCGEAGLGKVGVRTSRSAPLRAGQVGKTARRQLVAALKATALTVTGTRGMAPAEVTVGGVSWDEVDAATLQSRLVAGLFFAGEVLDLAGRCGGFNLQAAFSTGFLAGRSAAQLARDGA
jgi:predicted flavoprotein YhiN